MAFDMISMALDMWDPNGYNDFVGLGILEQIRNTTIAAVEQAWRTAGEPYPPFASVFSPMSEQPITNLEYYVKKYRDHITQKRNAALAAGKWIPLSDYVMNYVDTETSKIMDKRGNVNYFKMTDDQRRQILTHPDALPVVKAMDDVIKATGFKMLDFALSEDDETRNSDEVWDTLVEADMFIQMAKIERKVYSEYNDAGEDISGPEYDPTLYSKIACVWFNKYEKPLNPDQFGAVYVEGIGCSLDQKGCELEEKRLVKAKADCKDDECPTESVYWSDVYWERDKSNPGPKNKPNVRAVKLPTKACLNSHFRDQIEACHGETKEFKNGKWQLVNGQKKMGTWNDKHQLCDYSESYCKKMGLKVKSYRRKAFPGDAGEIIKSCVMFPGQGVAEMIFGTTITRSFIKLTDMLGNPSKKTIRDFKNGKNFIGAALYYGTPLGVIAEGVNFVTNPAKFMRNVGKSAQATAEKAKKAVAAAKKVFKNVGGTVDKFLEKIPAMGAVYSAGKDVLEFVSDYGPVGLVKVMANGGGKDAVYAIGDGVKDGYNAVKNVAKDGVYAAGDLAKDAGNAVGDGFKKLFR